MASTSPEPTTPTSIATATSTATATGTAIATDRAPTSTAQTASQTTPSIADMAVAATTGEKVQEHTTDHPATTSTTSEITVEYTIDNIQPAASPPEPLIEAEDLDSDSGYDTDNLSVSQASVASSAFEFIHQHGHRYHRKDEALLPNDETEQDRLDFQHHIFKMLLGGHLTYTVLPNDKPLQIIDVGCGTGIWAIEMGDALPMSTIRGIDESPIQPHWVPPNVQFEIDDVTKPWLTKASSIDFIHIRTMAGCIPSWLTLLQSSLRALKPGGSIEVTDIMWNFDCQDGSMAPDCASVKWADQFHELASAIFHVDFGPSPKMAGWLEEAGFEDVEVQTKIVPVGPWPKDRRLKEIGLCFLSQMLEGGMENYSMGLFTKAGWDATEVHAMLGRVRSEITNPRVHGFTRAWFITGRKKENLDGAVAL